MKRFYLLILFSFFSTSIAAEHSENAFKIKSYALAIDDKKVKLSKLLDATTKNTGKQFMLHANSRAEVVANGIDVNTMSYDQLLAVVELNEMAAVEISGVTKIIPVNRVKQSPIPLLNKGDTVSHGTLWVTRIIDAGNENVHNLIPILRTLVPVSGHMASDKESNSIVLVAPYHSVVRIERIIQELGELKAKKRKTKA